MMNAGIPNAMRRAVYRRDGFMCALCGNNDGLCVHHFIRRGEGGGNHPHNLITLCGVCHRQIHGDFTPDELAAGFDAAAVNQAAVEYLADYYADIGEVWNPWLKPGAMPARLDHGLEEGWRH